MPLVLIFIAACREINKSWPFFACTVFISNWLSKAVHCIVETYNILQYSMICNIETNSNENSCIVKNF